MTYLQLIRNIDNIIKKNPEVTNQDVSIQFGDEFYKLKCLSVIQDVLNENHLILEIIKLEKKMDRENQLLIKNRDFDSGRSSF